MNITQYPVKCLESPSPNQAWRTKTDIHFQNKRLQEVYHIQTHQNKGLTISLSLSVAEKLNIEEKWPTRSEKSTQLRWLRCSCWIWSCVEDGITLYSNTGLISSPEVLQRVLLLLWQWLLLLATKLGLQHNYNPVSKKSWDVV